VWLVAAGLETVQAPLVGRLTDRRGKFLPVQVAVAVGCVVSLGLAASSRPLFYAPLIVVGAMAYGVLFTPAFALIADGAEEARLAQGMAFGFMNAAWALGAVAGPAAGGAIANATGDWFPFVLAAGLCAVAFVVARRRSGHERAAILIDGLPGHPARVGRE
jgi:MFS family permease